MQMQDSCVVRTLDGRRMELCSPQGANPFINLSNPFNYFSVNLPIAETIYKKAAKRSSKSVKAAEKQQLIQLYFTVDSFAQYSHQETFLTIPESEIKTWFKHVIPLLLEEDRHLKQNPKWIQQGKLERHEAFVIHPNISLMQHEVLARLGFEMGFFEALAQFIVSCQVLPSQDIAETICLICGNMFITLTLGPKPWTCEKFFKKLEATGLLVQLL